jgi:hypothetical protein
MPGVPTTPINFGPSLVGVAWSLERGGGGGRKKGRLSYGRVGHAALIKKNPIEATTSINTAFKICFARRKNELLNRLPSEIRFLCFWLW